MKGYKIFLAWFLTVLFGSIGLPLWFEFYGIRFSEGTRFFRLDGGDLFFASLACMLVSGLISLPTILTLIITNIVLKRKGFGIKKHFRKINFTHFIMALLTLIIAEGWLFLEFYAQYNAFGRREELFSFDLMPLFWFFIVMLWYVLCAFACWFLLFKNIIKLQENEENLDEIGL
jgi:lysylphosphatidylglycerol synthetase-like protein (DUF2156 family)